MNNDEKYIKYGKLLSGLIHNLNTPLMGCTGRVELLQMKMGEDKNLSQIATQLDKINSTLISIAYILDKDNMDRVTMIDMKNLLDHYFSFLQTDMRFKHQVPKNINLNPRMIKTNPSEFVNYLHKFLDYLLKYLNGAALLEIDNICDNDKTVLNMCLSYESGKVDDDFVLPLSQIVDNLKESFSDEILERYNTIVTIKDDVCIKIYIQDTE
jgi:signal transduction histidine kinase